MRSYIVVYTLKTPGKDYVALWKALMSYPRNARIDESVWIVESSGTAATIRDHLARSIDANDRLYVGGLTGEAAWTNLPKQTSDWLRAA